VSARSKERGTARKKKKIARYASLTERRKGGVCTGERERPGTGGGIQLRRSKRGGSRNKGGNDGLSRYKRGKKEAVLPKKKNPTKTTDGGRETLLRFM